ncbi:uncharacterized protein TNCV_1405171 [Trichonephila clavipes]|nr:uncharacterized protein TNCV_1405171 [Trichonephila clavipes]
MNFRFAELSVLLRMFPWPLRSPDLTPCDFILGWYFKDLVYVSPLSQFLVELKESTCAAVQIIGWTILRNIWNELNHRPDVCRVTKEALVELL